MGKMENCGREQSVVGRMGIEGKNEELWEKWGIVGEAGKLWKFQKKRGKDGCCVREEAL